MVKVTLVGSSTLVLPVTPEEIKVESEQIVNKFYNYWSGYNVRKSHLKPKVISFSSFFPALASECDEHIVGTVIGLDCVKTIESWRRSLDAIRVIIPELSIDGYYCIESFPYSIGRSGNINYSISLCEKIGR